MCHNKFFVIFFAFFFFNVNAHQAEERYFINDDNSMISSMVIKKVPNAAGCVNGRYINLTSNYLFESKYSISFDVTTDQVKTYYKRRLLKRRYKIENDPLVFVKIQRIEKAYDIKVPYQYYANTLDEAISRCHIIINGLNDLMDS